LPARGYRAVCPHFAGTGGFGSRGEVRWRLRFGEAGDLASGDAFRAWASRRREATVASGAMPAPAFPAWAMGALSVVLIGSASWVMARRHRFSGRARRLGPRGAAGTRAGLVSGAPVGSVHNI
jgi:hypothetical protein